MRFGTILFDVGDTLVKVPKPAAVYQKILARHGCPLEMAALEEILREARRLQDEHVPNWLSEDLVLDSVAAKRRRAIHVETIIAMAGVSRVEEARAAFYDLYIGTEFFTLFPDVCETLRALQAEGYRLGIVSNWESRLLDLCSAHGIGDAFDFAVISEVEGYSKPHAQLYRRALELAAEPADRVVHVGDKLREDVEGAANVGINAVLIDRSGEAAIEYEPRISTLTELPDLLRRL